MNEYTDLAALYNTTTGRDATREFEDVGHSGDARLQLDSLVIGSVRPATDEELRISRVGGGVGGKAAEGHRMWDGVFNGWIQDHGEAFRKTGIIALTSAVILGAAILMQRYGSKTFYQGKR